jgi:hypothetical protein
MAVILRPARARDPTATHETEQAEQAEAEQRSAASARLRGAVRTAATVSASFVSARSLGFWRRDGSSWQWTDGALELELCIFGHHARELDIASHEREIPRDRGLPVGTLY